MVQSDRTVQTGRSTRSSQGESSAMVALPIGEVRSKAPRRRLVGRFSSGHLVMIVAGLLGMVLGIAALRHEPEGVEVAVAAHEIRAGETVATADFRSTRVRMPQRLLATLVLSSRVR